LKNKKFLYLCITKKKKKKNKRTNERTNKQTKKLIEQDIYGGETC
jgi:hypothetical protein